MLGVPEGCIRLADGKLDWSRVAGALPSELTPGALDLLVALARRDPQPVTTEELMADLRLNAKNAVHKRVSETNRRGRAWPWGGTLS